MLNVYIPYIDFFKKIKNINLIFVALILNSMMVQTKSKNGLMVQEKNAF